MKTIKPLLFTLLLVMLMSTSCTWQKRVYRSGYTFFKTQHTPAVKKESKRELAAKASAATQEENANPELYTALGKQIITERKPFTLQTTPVTLDSCGDIMVLQNGEEKKVKVLEISPKEVKYKPCSNLEGPVFVVNIEKVKSITYLNGTKEVFKVATKPVVQEQKQPANYSKPRNGAPTNNGNENNVMAILSFVSVCLFFLYFTLVLALIFGIIALVQIKNNPGRYKNQWMAVVGVTIPAVLLIIMIALIVALAGM